MGPSWRASIAHMTRAGVVLLAALLIATGLVAAITAEVQQLEPRAYSNTPVGMNFLILGYGFTTGDVSLDTSLPVEDAKFTVHSSIWCCPMRGCRDRPSSPGVRYRPRYPASAIPRFASRIFSTERRRSRWTHSTTTRPI